jgi:hypothetical protein
VVVSKAFCQIFFVLTLKTLITFEKHILAWGNATAYNMLYLASKPFQWSKEYLI